MSETGTVWETTCTIEAQLPQEAFDKILGNTPEEMDRMLKPGYAFDLSDGKDRSVTYISFPQGTEPEDVSKVVRCGGCKRWNTKDCGYVNGLINATEHCFCSYGDKRG